MLLVPTSMFLASTGSKYPSRTLTTKNFLSGAYIGFISPTSPLAGFIGSGGSLVGDILPNFPTEVCFQITEDFSIMLIFSGDATAQLAEVTGMKINLTSCPVIDDATYSSEEDNTTIYFDGSAIHMTAPTSYTVRLE